METYELASSELPLQSATFTEVLDELEAHLESPKAQVLAEIRPALENAFTHLTGQLKTIHANDLRLQLEAMKITQEQVHKCQIDMLMKDVNEKHQAELDILNDQLKQQTDVSFNLQKQLEETHDKFKHELEARNKMEAYHTSVIEGLQRQVNDSKAQLAEMRENYEQQNAQLKALTETVHTTEVMESEPPKPTWPSRENASDTIESSAESSIVSQEHTIVADEMESIETVLAPARDTPVVAELRDGTTELSPPIASSTPGGKDPSSDLVLSLQHQTVLYKEQWKKYAGEIEERHQLELKATLADVEYQYQQQIEALEWQHALELEKQQQQRTDEADFTESDQPHSVSDTDLQAVAVVTALQDMNIEQLVLYLNENTNESNILLQDLKNQAALVEKYKNESELLQESLADNMSSMEVLKNRIQEQNLYLEELQTRPQSTRENADYVVRNQSTEESGRQSDDYLEEKSVDLDESISNQIPKDNNRESDDLSRPEQLSNEPKEHTGKEFQETLEQKAEQELKLLAQKIVYEQVMTVQQRELERRLIDVCASADKYAEDEVKSQTKQLEEEVHQLREKLEVYESSCNCAASGSQCVDNLEQTSAEPDTETGQAESSDEKVKCYQGQIHAYEIQIEDCQAQIAKNEALIEDYKAKLNSYDIRFKEQEEMHERYVAALTDDIREKEATSAQKHAAEIQNLKDQLEGAENKLQGMTEEMLSHKSKESVQQQELSQAKQALETVETTLNKEVDAFSKEKARLLAQSEQILTEVGLQHSREMASLVERHQQELDQVRSSFSADQSERSVDADTPSRTDESGLIADRQPEDMYQGDGTDLFAHGDEQTIDEEKGDDTVSWYMAQLKEKRFEELENVKVTIEDENINEVKNIRVAMKCEITTILSKYGIKRLSELVKNANKEMLAENMQKLEEMAAEMEHQHQIEILEIRKNYEDQIVQIREESSERQSERGQIVDELQRQHNQELEQVKADHQRRLQEEIDRLRKELSIAHDDQLDAVALDTDQVKEELELANMKQIEELLENHQTEISELNAKHSAQIQTLAEKAEGNLELKELELDELREHLLQQKESDLADIKHELLLQKHQEVEEMRAQIENDAQTKLSQMKDEEISKIREELVEKQKELDQIRLEYLKENQDSIDESKRDDEDEMEKEITYLRAENVELKEILEKVSMEYENRQQDWEECESQKEEEIGELQHEIQHLQQELEDQTNDEPLNSSKVQHLETSITAKDRDLVARDEQIEQLNKRINDLTKQLEETNTDSMVEKVRAEFEQNKKDWSERYIKEKEMENEETLTRLRDEYQQNLNEALALQKEQNDIERDEALDRLKCECEEYLENALASQKQEYDVKMNDIAKLEKECRQCQDKAFNLENALALQKQQYDAKSETIAKLEKELRQNQDKSWNLENALVVQKEQYDIKVDTLAKVEKEREENLEATLALQKQQNENEEMMAKLRDECERNTEKALVLQKQEIDLENVTTLANMKELYDRNLEEALALQKGENDLENDQVLAEVKEECEQNLETALALQKHLNDMERDESLAELALESQQKLDEALALQKHENNVEKDTALAELKNEFERNLNTALALQKQQHNLEMEESLVKLEYERERKLEEALASQHHEYEEELATQSDKLVEEMNKQKEDEMKQQRDQLEQEISALRQSLELVQTDDDDQRNLQNQISQLQERHHTTLSAKDEQCRLKDKEIDTLNENIVSGQEEIEKCKEKIAILEKTIEEQKEHYELALTRRFRENEEAGNLHEILRADLEKLNTERASVQQINERLLSVLSDSVRNNLAAEDKINKRLAALVQDGRQSKPGTPVPGRDSPRRGSASPGIGTPPAVGRSNETALHEHSALSMYSDEGLDLSNRASDSLFVGPDLEPEGEEIVIDASSRLQTGVEKLLDMIEETTRQLNEAHATQNELLDTVKRQGQQLEEVTTNAEDLGLKLEQETEAREFLAGELQKAESLLQSYAEDKQSNDEKLQTLEDDKITLTTDLERCTIRLAELEDAQSDVRAREQVVQRQQSILQDSVGEEQQVVKTEDSMVNVSETSGAPEQGLLEECERLTEEKRELEKHYDGDRDTLEARVRQLTAQLEELREQNEHLQEERKVDMDDLQSQLEVAEKQLKVNKQFLEEQALEREQEREEFQRDIHRLNTVVKGKEKQENIEQRLQRQLQDLEDQLKERIDMHNEALLKKEQLERDISTQQATNLEIQDMLKQAEVELESRFKIEQDLRQKIKKLENELSQQNEPSEDGSAGPDSRAEHTIEELQRTINDLEAQVQTLQLAEQLALQKVRQLEESHKNLKTLEEELTHDKNALQQQVFDQLHQIAVLRAQVDEMKLGSEYRESEQILELKEMLDLERDAIENKNKEICDLSDQLEQFREQMLDKDDELQQLRSQIQVTEKESHHYRVQLEEQLEQLEQDKQQLELTVRSLREQVESTPMPVFAKNLIDEKNSEIDHLNSQIEELREELRQKKGKDAESAATEQLYQELEAKKAEIAEYIAQIEELKQAIEARNKSDEILSETQQAAEQDQSLLESLAQKNELIRELSEQLAQVERIFEDYKTGAEKEMENLRTQLTEKDFDLAESQEELDRSHREEMESLNKAIEDKDLEVTSMCKMLQQKDEVIRDLNDRCDQLDDKVVSLTEMKNQLHDDLDQLHNMLEEKENENRQLEQDLEDARAHIPTQDQLQEEIESELQDAKDVIKTQEEELANQNAEIRTFHQREPDMLSLQSKIQVQEDTITQLRNQLNQSQTGHKAAQEQLNQAIQELSGMKQKLTEMQKSHQEEVERIVSENERNLQQALADANERFQQHKSQDGKLVAASVLELEELRRLLAESERRAQAERKAAEEKIRELTDVESIAAESKLRELNQRDRAHHQDMIRVKEMHDQDKQRSLQHLRIQEQRNHMDEINRLQRDIQRLQSALETGDSSLLEPVYKVEQEMDKNESLDGKLFFRLRQAEEMYNQSSPRRLNMVNGYNVEEDSGLPSDMQPYVSALNQEGRKILSVSQLDLLLRQTQFDESEMDAAWREEKQSLLKATQALKDLLAETQRTDDVTQLVNVLVDFMSDPDIWVMSHFGGLQSDRSGPDWRSDIVRAVHNVFDKERANLAAELHTHRILNGDRVAPTIDMLKQKVQQQDALHKVALQQIHSADRQSLLDQVRDLQKELHMARLQLQDQSSKWTEQMGLLEEQYIKKERHLKRQNELLEYRVQQEKVVADDLRSSLDLEKTRSIESASQMSKEKMANTNLQNELDNTQIQLSKLKDILDQEHNKLVSTTASLEEERKRKLHITEKLALETANNKQYVEELELKSLKDLQYKNQAERLREDEDQPEDVEQLKQDLQRECDLRAQALSDLEREGMVVDSIRRELELEKEQHRNIQTSYKNKISDIHASLDMEKARSDEFNSALQRERLLSEQLRDALAEERGNQQKNTQKELAIVGDLQAMLDLERSKLLDVQNILERERNKVVQLTDQMDKERNKYAEETEKERVTSRQLRHNLERTHARKEEVKEEVEHAREKLNNMQSEKERQQKALESLKEKLRQVESEQRADRALEKDRLRQRDQLLEEGRHKKLALEKELNQLRQRVSDLEWQLAESQRNELQTKDDEQLQRLKTAMTPPKRSRNYADETDSSRLHNGLSTSPSKDKVAVYQRQLESCRQQLQLLGIRHQEELARHSMLGRQDRSNGRRHDGQLELQSIGRALKDILLELQHLQRSFSVDSPDEAPITLSVVPGLNENVLRQNAELTSYISQLSEEKRDLIQSLSGLEQDSQQKNNDDVEGRLATERSRLEQDKAEKSMQLHEADQEIGCLNDTIRRLEIELEREREKYFVPANEFQTSNDKEKMQRLYGKYLRAESFRKSLIYQKKYLLILIGGFRDCEEQTLAMIAEMGAYPSPKDLELQNRRHKRPLNRFRTAVRVVIAISRMRFIVRKWKRATRVGSQVVAGNIISDAGATYRPVTSRAPYVSRRTRNAPTRVPSTTVTTMDQAASDPLLYSNSRVAPPPPRLSQHHTPPTRDLAGEWTHSIRYSPKSTSYATRRPILSALDPMQEPTAVPTNSITSRGDTSPMSNGAMDESVNNYIHRLETLQKRLGQMSEPSRSRPMSRR